MKRDWLFLVYIILIMFAFTDNNLAMSAQKKPTTVAELALYDGTDRQQILEEGARKEGKLLFYSTGAPAAIRPVVDAFQKKYPFIKVEFWRASSSPLVSRLFEEFKSNRLIVDAVEGSQGTIIPIMEMQKPEGMLLPFYSPNLKYILEDAITKASGEGAFSVAFWESGHSLGYNTNLITKKEVPKTHKDLLDPKWKGKGTIVGSDTGINWMENMLETYGEEFVEQIANQNFAVQMMSAAAIIGLVISGEYAFSPTITDAHVKVNKLKGSPVEWVPLEPVNVNLGQIAMIKYAPHPHAALLFIDFRLSKEVTDIYEMTGYNPTRKDVPGVKTYKKFYGSKSEKDLVKYKTLFGKLFLKNR